MDSLKDRLQGRLAAYQPKPGEEKKRALPHWQEYALKVCQDFKLEKPMQGIIWRYAKHNLGYLESKVAMAYEKAELSHQSLDLLGHYLISLFRKKRPWEKD